MLEELKHKVIQAIMIQKPLDRFQFYFAEIFLW